MIAKYINATFLGEILVLISVITTFVLYLYSKKKCNVSYSMLFKNFIFGLVPVLGIIIFFYFMNRQKKMALT